MRRFPAIVAGALKWRDFYPWSLFTVNQKHEIRDTHAAVKRKDARPLLVLQKVHVDEAKALIESVEKKVFKRKLIEEYVP